jgi:hypothetical protein
MMRTLVGVGLSLSLILALVCCRGDKLPSRDQIPVLRQTLGNLERAIAARSAVAIDSMASVDMVELGLSSDSLMSLVYGSERDFSFARLGNYEIFYDRERAMIDCEIQDSSNAPGRTIKLYFKLDGKRWLLTRFEVAKRDSAAVADTPR